VLTDRSGGKVVETTAEKPGIFISYARSDSSALADELGAGLELAGFRPFLDRHDIAAAEDWEARLGALILGADTVVFILSPAAVRSERCAWEVERAAELGKRLIPVQGAPVPEAEVPERLRRLNYIFFREGQSVTRPLRELAATLRDDVEWIREHTRVSEAAARWQARDRGIGAANDLLLRGDDLADAKAWVARRKENAPEITALLTSFLTESEARAAALANEERERLAERERLVAERERAQHNVRRVQRRWFAILAGLALVVVLGTGAGLWSVFDGWRDLMTTRSQFIAGIVDQQNGKGDHVGAMLIGLDALPDETSEGIRQRLLRLDMSTVNALDGAWRNWLSGWGERTVLAGHTDSVWAVAFSPDGTRILTGSGDNTARLWDAATGKLVATLVGHAARVFAVAFSPDGTRVLTGSWDGTARLWDTATGTAVATLAGHTDSVSAVAFSPDGTRVLTGSNDTTARLWDAATGKLVATLAGHLSAVFAVAFSPDGTRVLTGSWDRTARLWDAATGKVVATLAGHTDVVRAVAFSPDGTRVLTGSYDNTARLWDAATSKVVATLAGHTNYVFAVAFSPDGTRVLTGSGDTTARLWDTATGTAVGTFAGHTDVVKAVAFSPDGTRVLTGSNDTTARLWSVFKSARALINIVRTSVARCLTPMQREAFHLGTPPPRWCYERDLWPFADHGQSYIGGGSPPYGPPATTWDERLLAAWDWIGSWFSRPVAKRENRSLINSASSVRVMRRPLKA
jgi:streptogramin lyase